MRRFTHTLILKLYTYKTKLYDFLGPAPSETRW